MKKIIMLAFIIAPAAVWAQKSSFTLQGKIGTENTPAKAYLIYPVAGNYIIDSAVLNNGAFAFKGTLTEPVSAQLVIDHKGIGLDSLRKKSGDVQVLYLEKGNITINGKDSAATALVTGSKLNDENRIYANAVKVPESEMVAEYSAYLTAAANKDSARLKDIVALYNKASDDRKAAQIQFIQQNPGSYLSLLTLMQIGGDNMNPAFVEPLYKALRPEVRQTETGQNFGKSIAIARATAIGAIAPVFTQNDVNNKPVSLADFKGKYVLLDFWASWCGPCRKENPNIVKAYNAYKDKNFTVLGVSLDKPGDKDKWLAAIKTDGLTWTQVSDLQFDNNAAARLYGVTGIPQNFLIDPNGRIIGKNLRGEDLNNKLASLFNSQPWTNIDTTGYFKKDSTSKGGYTLIFINKDSLFSKETQQRLTDLFFIVYPEEVMDFNKKSAAKVTFVIDPKIEGVAATDQAISKFNPQWFKQQPEDIDCATHELMHIVQDYNVTDYATDSLCPGWLVEGIADYARYKFGINNIKSDWTLPPFSPSQNYTDAYRVTARFLVWLEQHNNKYIVRDLNNTLRKGEYNETTWIKLTGKTLDQLWMEYSQNPSVQLLYDQKI